MYTVFTPGSWLTMMNGPVPLALSANGLSEVAEAVCACTAPFASAHFLEIMYQVSHSACRIGLGEVRMKSTVWSSTFTAFMSAGARVLICEPGLRMRSVEKTTSSAVKSSPSWNFTPLRRWKRHLSGSTISQRSARPGTILRSLSRLVRPSMTLPSAPSVKLSFSV